MTWLSSGIALRKAAQVLGASSSSKRAWNVKSPAWTMSWLMQNSRDGVTRRVLTKQIAAEAPGSKEQSSRRTNSRAFCNARQRPIRSRQPARAFLSLENATRLFARSLSFIGPAENPASLYFRLRSRHVPGFGLRRRWRRRRQILAFHRIHQLAVFRPADRGAIVDTGGRALG